jgi:hypothetical protein
MLLKIKIVDLSETKNISLWQAILRDIFSVFIWFVSFPLAIYIPCVQLKNHLEEPTGEVCCRFAYSKRPRRCDSLFF